LGGHADEASALLPAGHEAFDRATRTAVHSSKKPPSDYLERGF
jgi:hypothetical protein